MANEPISGRGARVLGLSGAARHGCVAVRQGDRCAASELERTTRTRGQALTPGEWPAGTLASLDPRWAEDLAGIAVAEPGIVVPSRVPVVSFDHHQVHAITAAATSPFDRTAVLVCDAHGSPPVSVWIGAGSHVRRVAFPWKGMGFAELYSEAAAIFGFNGPGRERTLEALARGAPPSTAERLMRLWTYGGDHICLHPSWRAGLANCVQDVRRCPRQLAGLASAFQHCLGSLLIELVAELRGHVDADALCLAGGLFHNTNFNTRVYQSQLFARTFVPVNPGNAGLAIGSVMALSDACGLPAAKGGSAFLGPGFSSEEIKETLDNCKLPYEFLNETEIVERTADRLRSGLLVGWFQGRMEWGPRALGHRSILASPLAPHVLENLNTFLKRRPSFRALSLSVLEEQLARYFCGPSRSPHMEYEYAANDPDIVRAVLPPGTSTIRVQSVGDTPPLFRKLHEAFAGATGIPMLVNTSFNGFSEPIVCCPRDAVRVYYGSGLDLLVIGRFVLEK